MEISKGLDKTVFNEIGIQVVAVVVVLILVLLPIGFLIFGSFYSAPPGASGHLTLDNFKEAFNYKWYFSSTLNSLKIAVLSSLIASIFGITMGWLTSRTNMPFRNHMHFYTILPIFLSPFMGAVAWNLLANPSAGLITKLFMKYFPFLPPLNINSLFGISFVMGLYYTPYIYLFVSGALKSMDPSLEEAARVSGASLWTTTVKISLPLILPAILSGILLVFVISAGQFAIPAVLGWRSGIYVLTTRIYTLISAPPINYGVATVLCLTLSIITAIGIYFYRKFTAIKKFTTISGKGYRPHVLDIGAAKYIAVAFCFFYIFIAAVLPLSVILVTSFSMYTGKYFPPTLLNYDYLFNEYKLFWLSLKNSILVSTIGASICMILAILVSWVIHRTKYKLRFVVDYITTLPISIAAIVMAVGILWSWIYVDNWLHIGVYGTIWLLIIACISRFITYGVRSTSSTLVQIGPELEESARVCGASWSKTLLRITVPLLKPGIVSGWILLFIVFFRELAMVLLLYSTKSITLSILIYELWGDGIYPQLCALGVIQVLVISVLILIFNTIFKTRVDDLAGS